MTEHCPDCGSFISKQEKRIPNEAGKKWVQWFCRVCGYADAEKQLRMPDEPEDDIPRPPQPDEKGKEGNALSGWLPW